MRRGRGTRLIAAKVTEKEMEYLQEYIARERYNSISRAIREGLRLLFAKEGINPKPVVKQRTSV